MDMISPMGSLTARIERAARLMAQRGIYPAGLMVTVTDEQGILDEQREALFMATGQPAPPVSENFALLQLAGLPVRRGPHTVFLVPLGDPNLDERVPVNVKTQATEGPRSAEEWAAEMYRRAAKPRTPSVKDNGETYESMMRRVSASGRYPPECGGLPVVPALARCCHDDCGVEAPFNNAPGWVCIDVGRAYLCPRHNHFQGGGARI